MDELYLEFSLRFYSVLPLLAGLLEMVKLSCAVFLLGSSGEAVLLSRCCSALTLFRCISARLMIANCASNEFVTCDLTDLREFKASTAASRLRCEIY